MLSRVVVTIMGMEMFNIFAYKCLSSLSVLIETILPGSLNINVVLNWVIYPEEFQINDVDS